MRTGAYKAPAITRICISHTLTLGEQMLATIDEYAKIHGFSGGTRRQRIRRFFRDRIILAQIEAQQYASESE